MVSIAIGVTNSGIFVPKMITVLFLSAQKCFSPRFSFNYFLQLLSACSRGSAPLL